MESTPTINKLPFRFGDFSTLAEALDYAGQGETGFNFYSGTGKLAFTVPYALLRQQAHKLARRLLSLGLERGDRVAIVAETHPDFQRFFFACQYAGLTPVALPTSSRLGGRKTYVAQLRRFLVACKAAIAIAPAGFLSFLTEAAEELDLAFIGDPATVAELPQKKTKLCPLEPRETAYLQFTSGSTRFPRGVMITQKAIMKNIADIIRYGVKIRPGDRSVSWLPYYHDMGLLGFVLAPLASQLSVDYLSTRDFAMRPRLWLSLMALHRATISFSPSFGYELCAYRLRRNGTAGQFDLSAWRVAGVGAETIRPESLTQFAELLAPSGFDKNAFLACYGMAECSLAVSFAQLGRGLEVDWVDGNFLAEYKEALTGDGVQGNIPYQPRGFVNCGKPIPDYDVEIRNRQGQALPERYCGTIYIRGPSLMSGYFSDPEETHKVLSPDGWLNTGDLGYRVGNNIVITGREKDLIILNGRNIWPQDLEYIAEQQPEVRIGDTSAFAVPGDNGEEKAVMLIQCRESSENKRIRLVKRLRGLIGEELGIECFIELVPRNTLPRTTSGKLFRSKARRDFLERVAKEDIGQNIATLTGNRIICGDNKISINRDDSYCLWSRSCS